MEFDFVKKLQDHLTQSVAQVDIGIEDSVYYLTVDTKNQLNAVWETSYIDMMFDKIVSRYTKYVSRELLPNGVIKYQLGNLFDFLKE
jgi:hypothetical protein